MMKRLLFLFFCCFSTALFSFSLNQHKQVLLVVADDWGCSSAMMWCCERTSSNSEWEIKKDNFPVRLCTKGLAWGRGLHPGKNLIGPKKREEDRRSPAGIFGIGPVMGIKSKEEINPLGMPYIHITPSLIAVNDIQSHYYNQIVDAELTQGDWKASVNLSACKSCSWGAVIEYNFYPSIPEDGSCTFLVENTDDPQMYYLTYTALKRKHLIEVLYWLRQADNPVIVQLTRKNYLKYKNSWQLPDLEWIK